MSTTPHPIRGKLYSIAACQPFIETLARGILTQAKREANSSSISFAEWLVFLPTRRACVELRQVLLRLSAQAHDDKAQNNDAAHSDVAHAVLLPHLIPLGERDEEETEQDAVSALERRLLLAQLIEKWLNVNQNAVRTSSAPVAVSLARALERLQVDFVLEEANPQETLNADTAPANCAVHWREALDFLRIVIDKWPQVLKTQSLQDPSEQLLRTLARHTDSLEKQQAPVIVAGSTGSLKATARLMRAVLALPQGQVVLAGCPAPLEAISKSKESLEESLEERLEESWEDSLEPTHPLHPFRALFASWGMEQEETANLLECYPASSSPSPSQQQVQRTALLARAFSKCPAPLQPPLEELSTGLTVLPCLDAQEEADLIALILRQALEEKGQRAALVTRDRTLARRVRSALRRRWNLPIEDTAQQPFAESRAAQLFLLTLKTLAPENPVAEPVAATPPLDIIALKALFACAGGNLALRWRNFESSLLRRADRDDPTKTQRTAASLLALCTLLAQENNQESNQALNATLNAALNPSLATLVPLAELLSGEHRPSRLEMLRCHRRCAENFAALCHNENDGENHSENDDKPSLYDGKDGAKLKYFCDTLEGHWQENLQEEAPEEVQDYLLTLEALLAAETLSGEYATHPRLAILGALEARLLSFDLLVLGGLTEGSWPTEPDKSPFLPESLRKKVGLKPLEHNIGLSALDFVNFASAPNKVIVAYAARHSGQPRQPSRFVQRLQACHPCRNPVYEAGLRAWLTQLQHGKMQHSETVANKEITAPLAITAPAPTAPLTARPHRLSLTSLTTLNTDPYSIYARQVLRLVPLEALLSKDEPALYGSCLHACCEEILLAYIDAREKEQHTSEPTTEQLETAQLESIIAKQLARFAPSRFAQAFWSEPLLRSTQQLLARVSALRPRRLWCEVKGEYRIALEKGREVTLSARADLILEAEDGAWWLIDHKTGALPTRKSLGLLEQPQLVLGAWLLQQGAFQAEGKKLQPPMLAQSWPQSCYWQFPVGRAGFRELAIDEKVWTTKDKEVVFETPQAFAEASFERYAALLQHFDREETPYPACALTPPRANYDPYRHLARRRAWSLGLGLGFDAD